MSKDVNLLWVELKARKISYGPRKLDRILTLARDDLEKERQPQVATTTQPENTPAQQPEEAPISELIIPEEDPEGFIAKQNPFNKRGRIVTGIWVPADWMDGSAFYRSMKKWTKSKLTNEMNNLNFPVKDFGKNSEKAAALAAATDQQFWPAYKAWKKQAEAKAAHKRKVEAAKDNEEKAKAAMDVEKATAAAVGTTVGQ